MKLNKILLGACALAFMSLFLFTGCASKDDGVKEVVFDAEDVETSEDEEEAEEEQDVTEDNAIVVTADEASSYQLDAVAPAGRDNKKNYTGWISTSIRPVSNVVGNISLFARPKKGTFSISVLNEDEKAIPVLSTANEYTTTSFYLKAGRKLVKLSDDSSVVTAAKKTEKGLKIRYSIEKVGVVIIDFECFSSVEGEPEDSIKVTAAIVSQSKKKTDFALKLLMDTVLGETDRHHFYTSEGLPVKSEVVYHSMDEEKWFSSKNAKATMQVILAGGECTPIESVALANYSTLDTKKWDADMTSFRSFDTVLSYNNSAVGIYWPKMTLQSEEEGQYVFYLSLGTADRLPGGAAYICAEKEAEEEEAGEDALEQEEASAEKPAEQETPVQNIEAVKETEEKPAEKPVEKPVTEPAETAAVPAAVEEPEVKDEKPQSVAAVEEKASEFDRAKLSPDYIQQLLDRIDELEEDDPDLNKVEINELNKELDIIINILNSSN